mmetsp:Transcript_5052/g.14886  ORF Transcript_5052/g.14886 Transcript_5052/m.14886 type:complete len:223 (+) Transcript_5052:6080-6748(+)
MTVPSIAKRSASPTRPPTSTAPETISSAMTGASSPTMSTCKGTASTAPSDGRSTVAVHTYSPSGGASAAGTATSRPSGDVKFETFSASPVEDDRDTARLPLAASTHVQAMLVAPASPAHNDAVLAAGADTRRRRIRSSASLIVRSHAPSAGAASSGGKRAKIAARATAASTSSIASPEGARSARRASMSCHCPGASVPAPSVSVCPRTSAPSTAPPMHEPFR